MASLAAGDPVTACASGLASGPAGRRALHCGLPAGLCAGRLVAFPRVSALVLAGASASTGGWSVWASPCWRP
eukprot:7626131-Pyramimonas_sp.AAC.1